MPRSDGRRRVGLALGGGGARGLAHIGVISVLEAARIPIDFVAGTSMGAMIGAAYCAGIEVPQLLENAKSTTWWQISRPTWPRHGWLSFDKMERWITDMIGDVDIRDLAIPFAATTTDIETGERVIFREGPVSKIVRASCSVPGIIEPLEYEGRLLCDGGISDNLPDYAARMLGADYVIGVDVFAPAFRRVLGPAGALLAAVETLVQHAGGGDLDADCLIIPDLVGKSFVRLSNYQEIIEAGERAALEMLPVIQEALADHSRSPEVSINETEPRKSNTSKIPGFSPA
ncbi:MAG: patatin-like phospholipase family protein [Candidatus Promineifilaceae bacterium]|nr:patatin-like phospholipase family protein [Candidatus Promineifilaceae bacterium]